MAGERLRIVTGQAAGMDIPLEGDFVVGREETGMGNLKGDPQISRHHARFQRLAGGQVLIEDLGSTNGTFVNGQRINGPHVLQPGDQIALGMTKLEFEGATEVGAPIPPAVAAAPAAAAPPAPAAPPVQPQQPAAAPPAFGPPGAVPRPGGVQPSGGAGRVRALLVALAVLLIAGAGVGGYLIGHNNKKKSSTTFSATVPSTNTSSGNQTAAAGVQGFVYVESNIAKPNGNTIIAYAYRSGGDLHPLKIAEYPTGGAGSADLTDSGVLDADQHLLVSPDDKLLFAVNQGSDTIAVFHINGDGSLSPAPGSPYPSGGMGPASVGLAGNHVIVVNKAQDGVRNLAKVNPVYASFNLQSDGSLQPTGSSFKAPPGFSPTQAQISTDKKVVMSTEEGGPLRAFTIGSDGKLTQGPNSPQSIPSSLYPASVPPKLRWALGLGVHPTQQILFAQLATIGKMAVYRYDDTARLTFVKAVPDTGAALNCWTLVNKDGSRVYTADAGNNTVGVFDTSDPLNPKQIQLLHLKNNGNPWDIRLDPTGKYIFLDDPRARMNVAPGQGNEIHTLLVGAGGKVTEAPSSPAPIPVALNVNPIGMAVVPRTG